MSAKGGSERQLFTRLFLTRICGRDRDPLHDVIVNKWVLNVPIRPEQVIGSGIADEAAIGLTRPFRHCAVDVAQQQVAAAVAVESPMWAMCQLTPRWYCATASQRARHR